MQSVHQKRERVLTLLGVVVLAAFYLWVGCPFRRLFGIACPGCGMTRAVRELLSFRFADAADAHPLVFLLPALLVWAAFALFGKRLPRRAERVCIFCLAALFLSVYVLRLVLGDPIVKPEFSNSVLHIILSFFGG